MERLPGQPLYVEISNEEEEEEIEYNFEIPTDGDKTPLPQEERETFDARPLKTRRLELEQLGEPGCRAECFGCVYAGEKDASISSETVLSLMEMARQSLGRTDMLSLAKGMSQYYEDHIRSKVNATLQPHERPLPPWPPAMVLDHLRNHNQDPLVQQVVILSEIQELRAELLDCCMETSSKTGKKRQNRQAVQAYADIVKLQFFVQKQEASKLPFYSHGARVNPDILSQGVLSTQTKRLHQLWK